MPNIIFCVTICTVGSPLAGNHI